MLRQKERTDEGGGEGGGGRQESQGPISSPHAANLCCHDGFGLRLSRRSAASPAYSYWFPDSLQTRTQTQAKTNARFSPRIDGIPGNASFGACRETLHGLPHEDRNAEKLPTFFSFFSGLQASPLVDSCLHAATSCIAHGSRWTPPYSTMYRVSQQHHTLFPF